VSKTAAPPCHPWNHYLRHLTLLAEGREAATVVPLALQLRTRKPLELEMAMPVTRRLVRTGLESLGHPPGVAARTRRALSGHPCDRAGVHHR